MGVAKGRWGSLGFAEVAARSRGKRERMTTSHVTAFLHAFQSWPLFLGGVQVFASRLHRTPPDPAMPVPTKVDEAVLHGYYRYTDVFFEWYVNILPICTRVPALVPTYASPSGMLPRLLSQTQARSRPY